MLSLLLIAAGVAAFEIAAFRYGADSRGDTPDGACGTPTGTGGRRWI
jgi:hypothetical protein